MVVGIGAMLPRDFLERQPKRWQKSQRKRRVLGTIRKLRISRLSKSPKSIEIRCDRRKLGESNPIKWIPDSNTGLEERFVVGDA